MALTGLFLILFTTVDRTPLEKTDHFTNTMQNLYQTGISLSRDTVVAGWSRVNITPEKHLPLAGYGDRRGAHSTGTKDSVYMRCLWLENEEQAVIVLTADILIFPPKLREHLVNYVESFGLSADNLYLSATHSHSSLGGWAPGLVGQLIIGDFDDEVLEKLKSKAEMAIEAAKQELRAVEFGYRKFRTDRVFKNRIVGSEGTISPWLKVAKLSSDDGQVIISSFPSHPTIYGSSNLEISGDYPGALTRELENTSGVDMAMFIAGPMASMGRPELAAEPDENVKATGKLLADSILMVEFPMKPLTVIGSKEIPFELGDAQVRISESLRIRPWLFSAAFGDPELFLSSLRLNDLLMISTPCDFSGEIAYRIDSTHSIMNRNIMINSFNGSYIGYITEDHWYDRPSYETRDMNWFGPFNGAYFTEMIDVISDKYFSTNP